MEKVSRTLVLTETKLKNFDDMHQKFGEFMLVSQSDKQPSHLVDCDRNHRSISEPTLAIGFITYGVDELGYLVWLGEIRSENA